MKKLLKRIVFIIFWQTLFLLTVFYVPEKYYPEWFVTFFLLLILMIFFSARVIPSKKREKKLSELLNEYCDMTKLHEDIKKDSMQLQYTCPACKVKNSFWSFLDEYRCNACGSTAWSSELSKYDDSYKKIFEKREKVVNYFSSLSPGIKRKLKNMMRTGVAR